MLNPVVQNKKKKKRKKRRALILVLPSLSNVSYTVAQFSTFQLGSPKINGYSWRLKGRFSLLSTFLIRKSTFSTQLMLKIVYFVHSKQIKMNI